MRALALTTFAVTQLACHGGPLTADFKLELGKDEVTLDARLHDIRLWTDDDHEQLKAMALFSSPENILSGWGKGLGWVSKVELWEWKVRGETVDLNVRAKMARSQFEACAKPERGKECAGFPLERVNGMLSALSLSKHKELEVSGPVGWPAEQTAMTLSYRWKRAPPFGAKAAFVEYASDAAGYEEAEQLRVRYVAALRKGELAGCRALLAPVREKFSLPVAVFIEEGARRERFRLLEALLVSQRARWIVTGPEALDRGFGPVSEDFAEVGLEKLKGKAPASLMQELLRQHDEAAWSFAQRQLSRRGGNEADKPVNLYLTLSSMQLEAACRELVKKNPAFSAVCALLTHAS